MPYTGGDTVSTALAAAYFYLSRYSPCYNRLATEIRSTFTSAHEIRNGTKLASCTYLRACIDETLRITPPICTTLWRQLPESDGKALVIDGQVIPPRTEVGVNIYTLHHNEIYFPDPFTFTPERWIIDASATKEDKHRKKLMYDAFTPFSMGSRGCAGKAMAYQEISLALAKTLWYLDFEQPANNIKTHRKGNTVGEGREKEFYVLDQFSSVHQGPNLTFRLRKGAREELIGTDDA